jgi:hypothetical protein
LAHCEKIRVTEQMFLLVVFAFSTCLCGPPVSAQAVDPPTGWKVSQEDAGWTYSPRDLPAGQLFSLRVDAPGALESASINTWFAERVSNDASKRGSVEQGGTIENAPLGMLTLERTYRTADKHSWHLVYVAFPLTERRALFCYLVSNLPESPAYHQYIHAGGKVCGQIAKNIDKSAANN